MYTLYYSPGSSSMAPHSMLEEVGATYELELVKLEDGNLVDRGYLAINPSGKVPALKVDGAVVSESAAICMFLADRHPTAGLAPPISDFARGRYYQWMSFLTNTLQVAFMRLYFPARYSTDAGAIDAIKAKARLDLAGAWRIIDQQLAGKSHLLGSALSTCDVYLHMLFAWLEEPLDDSHANVARWSELVSARPSIVRMLEQNA